MRSSLFCFRSGCDEQLAFTPDVNQKLPLVFLFVFCFMYMEYFFFKVYQITQRLSEFGGCEDDHKQILAYR